MMATNGKGALQSLGVIGGLIAALGGSVQFGGLAITEGDLNAVFALVTTIVTALGGLLSIWGRIRATRTITRIL